MPINLRFSASAADISARCVQQAALVLAGGMTMHCVTAGPPDPGAPASQPASPPAWSAQARRALDAWKAATTTEQKLGALESLVPLAEGHPLVLAATISSLGSGDPRVQARHLEILAQAGFSEAGPAARRALLDPDPALASTAAGVLGRLAPSGIRDALLAIWKQPQPPATATAEAATAALARAVRPADLIALNRDTVSSIRRAALAALRLQGSQACQEFLHDADTAIAESAVEAIYDDRLEGAWPALPAAGLDRNRPFSPGTQVRAIAAAWHTGGSAQADHLASWLAATPATTEGASATAPRAALNALLGWDSPPESDPLQSTRPFQARPRPSAECWPALERHASALAAWAGVLAGAEAAAWQSWQSRVSQAPRSPADLMVFLSDPAHPDGERLHHFRAWLNRVGDSESLATVAAAALSAPEAPALRAAARAWLYRQRSQGAVPWLLQSLTSATAGEKQAAIRLLDDHGSAEAVAYLLRLLGQARFGLVDPAVIPELVEAIERRARAEGSESRALRVALEAWRGSQRPSLGDPLRPWRPALETGDAEAGRAQFFSDAARCGTCHRSPSTTPEGVPLLGGVGRRLDGPAMLEAIVLPADPGARRLHPDPTDGGCRPMGTLLTLRELRDLLTYLKSIP